MILRGVDDILNLLDTGNTTAAQTMDNVNAVAVEALDTLPFIKAFAVAGIVWYLYNLKRR